MQEKYNKVRNIILESLGKFNFGPEFLNEEGYTETFKVNLGLNKNEVVVTVHSECPDINTSDKVYCEISNKISNEFEKIYNFVFGDWFQIVII